MLSLTLLMRVQHGSSTTSIGLQSWHSSMRGGWVGGDHHHDDAGPWFVMMMMMMIDNVMLLVIMTINSIVKSAQISSIGHELIEGSIVVR